MAASIAFPPSRRICAPTSLAVWCGVAMSPLVTSFAPCARPAALAGRYELDRAGLNLEQRGKETDRLAVEVDANLGGRCDGDALAIHELHFGIRLIQMLSTADVVHAAHGLDLAGVLDQDHIEYAVGRCG